MNSFFNDIHFSHVAVRLACSAILQRPELAKYGAQVGAILVKNDGEIVSAGWNDSNMGIRYHAEELVLQHAHDQGDLKDHTLYVSLEPCNGNIFHTREHCCEQIKKRGVGRTVYLVRKNHRQEGGAEVIRGAGLGIEQIQNGDLGRIGNFLAYAGKDGFKYNQIAQLGDEMKRLENKLPRISCSEKSRIAHLTKINI